MPVVPMEKVAIFCHKNQEKELFQYLQKSELFEIIPTPLGQKAIPEEVDYEINLSEVKSAIDFLENLSGKKKNIIETFVPPKEIVDEEILIQTYREFDWRSLVEKINNLESQLANLKTLEIKLRADIDLLKPWIPLNIALNQITCFEKVCVTTGICKKKDFDFLKKKIEKFTSAVEIIPVNVLKENIYVAIFYLSKEEKTLSDLLSKSNFEKVVLPISERNPLDEVLFLKQTLAKTLEDQNKYLEELRSLLKDKPKLTYVYDYLLQKRLEIEAKEKSATTEKTLLLCGWVSKKQLAKLKEEIANFFPLCEVQVIAPEKNEIPPTLIENPKVFYPFELITRIFGLPGPKEIDPTAFLSLFYLLFFAMCLSDVGYGIILSIVSLYFLHKLTLPEGGKKLLFLLFWGGITTIFVGMLTGSYFGLDLNSLPPIVSVSLKRLQFIDPIKNPLNVLILSLALGVIQNLFGIFLSMYEKLRSQDYISAILDDGLWIFFLGNLVLLVASLGSNSSMVYIFSRTSILGAILLVLTQGRREKNFLKKALIGILSLYRTTSYLGDTLSYSRLLALMMTTSIIGMVVNIIAGITKNSIPILGYGIMIAILLFGHTFNLVVSVLGAFIHSARLQLVEFFGKFYEGSGREFKPFRRETKYVIIR